MHKLVSVLQLGKTQTSAFSLYTTKSAIYKSTAKGGTECKGRGGEGRDRVQREEEEGSPLSDVVAVTAAQRALL